MKRIGNALLGKLNWGRACAVLALCAATAIALPAQTVTTLFSVDGTDGASPYAGLVQATTGDFYGTTHGGGTNRGSTNCAQDGCGTVFRITRGGTLTTLYNFCAQGGRACTHGASPWAGLVQAINGDLYGTTNEGGNGYGTIFKITPTGTFTTLYSFCAQSACADSFAPQAGLLQATSGDFYGTTTYGGANGTGGTIFRITPSGTLTTLYNFCAQSGCIDGQEPIAGLIQATNGDFYGTTYSGGANNSGTVFKITPGATLTTLYSFCAQSVCTDGAYPVAGLVQATSGDLYGTTSGGGAGGANGAGTAFKITPNGTLTTLYSFGLTEGGYSPSSALVQATNGDFYGTLYGGARYNLGTVFSLSVGLGPFVETLTTSGKVGAAVEILGTDLTGATSVTFNATAATFTVLSQTLITTTVPAGATTGTIQVVTPSATLLSNVPFRVLP